MRISFVFSLLGMILMSAASFKEGGVWKSKPVAYYEGGGTWLEMSKGGSTLKKMYNDLSDIVIKRQIHTDKEVK